MCRLSRANKARGTMETLVTLTLPRDQLIHPYDVQLVAFFCPTSGKDQLPSPPWPQLSPDRAVHLARWPVMKGMAQGDQEATRIQRVYMHALLHSNTHMLTCSYAHILIHSCTHMVMCSYALILPWSLTRIHSLSYSLTLV